MSTTKVVPVGYQLCYAEGSSHLYTVSDAILAKSVQSRIFAQKAMLQTSRIFGESLWFSSMRGA